MKIILAELPNTTTRPVKVTPPGVRSEGKLNLTFKKLDVQEAAAEVVLHDKALSGVDDEGNAIESSDIYAARAEWLSKFMLENLQEWDLEDGNSGEAYPLTQEVINKVLSIEEFHWPIYRDVLDYITKTANGKSKSDQEAELKNLLNLDKNITNKRRA